MDDIIECKGIGIVSDIMGNKESLYIVWKKKYKPNEVERWAILSICKSKLSLAMVVLLCSRVSGINNNKIQR